MGTLLIILSIAIIGFCTFMLRELLYKEHPFDIDFRSKKTKNNL